MMARALLGLGLAMLVTGCNNPSGSTMTPTIRTTLSAPMQTQASPPTPPAASGVTPRPTAELGGGQAPGRRPAAAGGCGPGVQEATPCPDHAQLLYGERTRTTGCTFRTAADGVSRLPDLACTPGAKNEFTTRDIICSVGWPAGTRFSTAAYRNVPQAIKEQVYAEYAIPSAAQATAVLRGTPEPRINPALAPHVGMSYEIDHLRSLEDGGSNDVANLWPQPAEPAPGYHQKDQVETWVHDQLCRRTGGAYGLSDAQAEDLARQLVADWTVLYCGIGAATLKGIQPKPSNGDQEAD